MDKKRLLILDAQNINSLAFVREMGKANHYVGVIGQSFMSLSFFSNYSDRNHVISNKLSDRGYVKQVIKIANEHNYDVIFPLSLKSFVSFSKYRSLLTKDLKIVIPPKDSMQIAYNKDQTFTHAKKNGIATPVTINLKKNNLSNHKSFFKNTNFPYVLKGSLSGINNVIFCNNIKQLLSGAKELLKNEKTIVCQEYVVGDTHGFYAYYQNDKLHSYFMHKRVKEYPITGGPSSVARSHYDDKLRIVSEKLLDSLNWNGPAMVEFKLDQNLNEYKLIEINPKLWGSLDLTISAGVNIPKIMLHHSLDKTFKSSLDYKDIYYRWVFPNEFMHNLASDFNVEKLEDGVKVETNILKEDMLPTFFQFSLAIFKSINYLIKGKLKYPSGKPTNY